MCETGCPRKGRSHFCLFSFFLCTILRLPWRVFEASKSNLPKLIALITDLQDKLYRTSSVIFCHGKKKGLAIVGDALCRLHLPGQVFYCLFFFICLGNKYIHTYSAHIFRALSTRNCIKLPVELQTLVRCSVGSVGTSGARSLPPALLPPASSFFVGPIMPRPKERLRLPTPLTYPFPGFLFRSSDLFFERL